ncbi:hypothetical protein L1987_70724 [Smallanthus sonchifolius]|uniref:Uncharacterized protein n=1 Tax=Smallanthus sonchifolius TaxID=185202 RepID=A0ACB9AQG8_9ASTR|nr:hypothetical protein L1987_70724 [Smallanthus sonchifolius]
MHTTTDFCVCPTGPDMHSSRVICEIQSVGFASQRVNMTTTTKVLEVRERVVMLQRVEKTELFELIRGEECGETYENLDRIHAQDLEIRSLNHILKKC